jgi:alkanesulfonate monooxygenase SsuD/methylene tetrahydromethanopterin reductase-like flavin-dependent oxidoreductase (luciferase family)
MKELAKIQPKIGTTIDFCGPKESIEQGVLLEKLGYDSLWAVDHLIDNGGTKIEPWTTISAISMLTQRISFCTAVTDSLRAHPAKLAHTIATLSEITNGRVSLGIGAGEAMNLIPFGLPFEKPKVRAERLGEAVQVIKLLFNSGRASPVSFKGRFFVLQNAWLDTKTIGRPPIYVGSLGGKSTLEVAGKYGDGWISWVNTPETFRKRLDIARSSASASGRDPANFEAIAWIFTTMSESGKEFEEAMSYTKKSLLAETHTLKSIGFDVPKQIGSPYQSMLVTDEGDRAVEEHQNVVPDDLAMDFLASGPPENIIKRIERFRDGGATQVILEFVQRREDTFRKYADKVLSYFHGC